MYSSVSVCILSKNSEKFIKKCLDSIINFSDEIILIDTGSTDKTVEISKQYTDKIYSFQWNNNFSDARNFAIQYVTKPWILWIDSDEELVIQNKDKFDILLNKENIDSFSVCIENELDNNLKSEVIRYRLLKTEKKYTFHGHIHEVPDINAATNWILPKDIMYLKHYGYNSEYVDIQLKNKRNEVILRDYLNKSPLGSWEHINNLIYFARETSDVIEKNLILRQVEPLINNYSEKEIKNNIVNITFFQEIIQNYKELDISELEEFYCLKAISFFPTELNLLSMAGEFYYKTENYYKSLEIYNKIIELVEKGTYNINSYIYSGIRDYGTFYNISLCYFQLNDINKSIEYAEKSLRINPAFIQVKNHLAKLKH